MFDPTRLRLQRDRAALLVIDVQERLSAAMPPEALQATVQNILRWIEGAKVLGLPIVWTEQYVKGLGGTVPELKAALAAVTAPIEKLSFSCLVDPVRAAIEGRSQLVCVGMETHVCVFQTVRDLEEKGLRAFVPGDAVVSRSPENWRVGLDLMRATGATITSTEAGLFDLTVRAGTDEFRAISKLVK